MKVFGLCFLVFVATVQARSTGVQTADSTAASPWVVHLRIATSTGAGILSSCVGSLVDNRWVLTSASCVNNVRFVWIRYGTVKVINPTLVTETSTANSNGDLALVSINRFVEYTDLISGIELASTDEVPATGTLCGYGAGEGNVAGEELSCSEWNLEDLGNGYIQGSSEGNEATQFDIGAPLVSNGVQIGVLTKPGPNPVFANTANYKQWVDGQITSSR